MGKSSQTPSLNLENLNPTGPRNQVLNSPRSLEACQRVGINPEDLFLLTVEELKDRLEKEGISGEEMEQTIQNYYTEMHAIYKELLMVRESLMKGSTLEKQKSRKKRKVTDKSKSVKQSSVRPYSAVQNVTKTITEQPSVVNVDNFFVSQVKELQKTIDQEVLMTLAAMKKKESQKILLKKRRREIIKTIGVKQRKHGLENLIQPDELNTMMRGVKSLNDLSKFEADILAFIKKRASEIKNSNLLEQEKQQRLKENMSLEQKMMFLNMLQEHKLQQQQGKLTHDDKIEIAKETKNLREEIRRQQILEKELSSNKKLENTIKNRQKTLMAKKSQNELKNHKKRLFSAFNEQEQEKKRQQLIDRLQKADFRLYVLDILKKEQLKNRLQKQTKDDESVKQKLERVKLEEMYRVAQIEFKRNQKDQIAGDNLIQSENKNKHRSLAQEYRYIQKQQKIKEMKDLEEFNRGVQLAKYCMRNEKYYVDKISKEIKEKDHTDLKKQVEDKKRQIHEFFQNARQLNKLPKNIMDLELLRDGVSQEVQNYLLSIKGNHFGAPSLPTKTKSKSSDVKKAKAKSSVNPKKEKKKTKNPKVDRQLADDGHNQIQEEVEEANDTNQEVDDENFEIQPSTAELQKKNDVPRVSKDSKQKVVSKDDSYPDEEGVNQEDDEGQFDQMVEDEMGQYDDGMQLDEENLRIIESNPEAMAMLQEQNEILQSLEEALENEADEEQRALIIQKMDEIKEEADAKIMEILAAAQGYYEQGEDEDQENIQEEDDQ